MRGQVEPGAGPPPTHTLPGSQPQSGSGLQRCAGREQAEGPGREPAARLPAHPQPALSGCVRGLGTWSQQQLQLTPACQAGLLDTPFLPFSSPIPPQFFSFGSTDGIRTQVSVGPERAGMVALLPSGHPGLRPPDIQLGSRASVPRPQGYTEVPSCPFPGPGRTGPTAAPPQELSFPLSGFSHCSEMHESCFFGEDRHPRLHTWHAHKSQDTAFSLSLPPRTRSAGSTLVPAKPQRSVISSRHPPQPLVTGGVIPTSLSPWLHSRHVEVPRSGTEPASEQ